MKKSIPLIIRTTLLMAMMVALGGCFEVQQKLTVHEDGEADLTLTVVLDEELAELSDDHSADCNAQFGFEDDLPPSLTKTTNSRVEDGNVMCDMTVAGPLVDMIPALRDYVESDSGNDFVLIQDLGDGQFALIGQYDFGDDRLDFDTGTGAESALERAIRGAVMASLQDAEISWEVSVPHVVETTGKVQPDGRVVWSLPLSTAVMEGKTYTFEVIFETQPKPKFF